MQNYTEKNKSYNYQHSQEHEPNTFKEIGRVSSRLLSSFQVHLQEFLQDVVNWNNLQVSQVDELAEG